MKTNTSLVKIERSMWTKLYKVVITENGWQWLVVYDGEMEKAEVIKKAFESIGYKGRATKKVKI